MNEGSSSDVTSGWERLNRMQVESVGRSYRYMEKTNNMTEYQAHCVSKSITKLSLQGKPGQP